ncbi:unnamed protein product, partial [Didymodactylos carnosus]
KEVFEAFGQYHRLLMTTKTYLRRARIRLERATTTTALLLSVDKDTLLLMIDQVINLLSKFHYVRSLIDDKINEHQTVTWWRNVTLGVLATASGFGLIFGFAVALKGVLVGL